MRQVQAFSGIVIGGAVALLAAQPVRAAATQVTAVRLNPNGGELELILETQAGEGRPQVFTVSRGNDLVADIVNTQLNLSGGGSFRQENPMPGIAAVAVNPLDGNSIRVTVSGADRPPTGQILQSEAQGIKLGFSTVASNQAAAVTPSPVAPPPQAAVPIPVPTVAAAPLPAPAPTRSPQATPLPSAPTPLAQTPTPQPTTPAPTPDVLFPNPEIRIDGTPAAPAGTVQPVAPAPSFLPRAVAPPVGDIAVSNVSAAPTVIDLGTAARVPRLVLREAPVREVLSLLARSAGLNLAFVGGAAGAQPGQPLQPGEVSEAGPTITLDIEDEPIQDVFNYVLTLSGLEANRIGRTIFVGSQLPNEARNVIVRSLRLNQVGVGVALNFLVGLGAESAVSRERLVTSVSAVPVPTTVGAATTPITQTQTTTEERLEIQRVDFQDSTPSCAVFRCWAMSAPTPSP